MSTLYSGEAAFCTLSKYFGWAKNPMIKRIKELDHQLPLTVIYGKESWMTPIPAEQFSEARAGKGYNKSWVRDMCFGI